MNDILELDCVATQQDTGTIYGIATASGKDNNGIYDTYVVLVKSNYSPTDLISLEWSIVSTTPALDLSYVYPTFATVDCAVSSKGDFIALFPNFELLTTKSPTIPMGVRYDPVSNGWSGIRGSPMYGWDSRPWHQLFYTMENGVESLVHLMADEVGTVVRFGTVDIVTNMLQLATIWKRVGLFKCLWYALKKKTSPPCHNNLRMLFCSHYKINLFNTSRMKGKRNIHRATSATNLITPQRFQKCQNMGSLMAGVTLPSVCSPQDPISSMSTSTWRIQSDPSLSPRQ